MSGKTKTIVIAAACALVLFLSWAGVRACRVSNSYARLAGAYDVLKAENAKIKTQAEADRAAAEETIAAKDASIIEHQHNEVLLGRKLTALDSDLSKLKGEFSLIKDCPGQVENLWSQVLTLEQVKADQGLVIVELRAQLNDWRAKYDAQVTISETWERQYRGERALRLNAEAMTAQLRRELWLAKFWSNVKTGIMVAEAAAWGYDHFSKKGKT